ncbi:Poglut1 [Symbiodinium pilosum]|uniref:Poglut1 protein n=1 Tax=Symbiodinium pilosum TaxID=2952 RepID=A0A812X9R5_SYMPI|nr:Poglut1 [Symbiodinium pilosum]
MVLGCSACAWTVWSWIFGPPAGSALRPLHPPDSCSRFSGQLYEQIYRDLAAYETLDAQRFAFYDGFCARRQKACIRLRIANGAAYVLDMFPGYQSRHRSTLHALYRAISRFGGLPDVEVTIDLTDGELQNIDLPIFVITHKKEAPAGILYPDFTFYSWPESVCPSSETETSHNYDHLYRHFRQHWGMGARWLNRSDTVFWRGAPVEDQGARTVALERIAEVKNSDAKFISWKTVSSTGQNDVQGCVGLLEQCRHRYLAFLAGTTYSSRIKYQLLCGSVVLAQEPRFVEWWSHLLLPGVHFAPVEPGWANIHPLMHLLRENPLRAATIARQGQQLAMTALSPTAVDCYWWMLLALSARVLPRSTGPLPPSARPLEDTLLLPDDATLSSLHGLQGGISMLVAPKPETQATAAETTGGRRLDIVNRCSRPMVIAPTGGNSEIPCGSGCPGGMVCNPERSECYFDFERPGEDWTIAPGETLVMHTPNQAVQQGNGVFAEWSGKIEFYPNHTQDGGLIPSAFCNNQAFCPSYQGLNGVATGIEFTFVPFGPDYYDVSIINGFNIGIEMKPNGAFKQIAEEAAGSWVGYNCGSAGASHQPDIRLSSCSWNFDPRGDGQDLGPLLRQVDGSGKSCTSDSDCIAGLVCGQVGVRTFNPVTKQYQPTEEIRMECGHQIGLWSAYQLCVWSGNRYVSPSPFDGLIDCPAHHNMFACAGHEPWITTCYSEGSHEDGCCGCADWADILDIPVPQAHGCRGNSTTWEESALPYYEILKRGCPTAYTYAYDDESSTFTCQSANSRQEESEAACATYTEDLCPHPQCAWYGMDIGCQVKANDAGYIITLCPEAPEGSWNLPKPPQISADTPAMDSDAAVETTTQALPTTTTWSCQPGDVVPCCVDRDCLETCAGNQCCPDGTACPSATDDFALCPAPRLYTCPPETTTQTTTFSITATTTATQTSTSSTLQTTLSAVQLQTSLRSSGRMEATGEVATSGEVLVGDIHVELSAGNASLWMSDPGVQQALRASLRTLSSHEGIPLQNVHLTADPSTSTFHYRVQLPADFSESEDDIGKRMANLSNQWTEELKKAVHTGKTGNVSIQTAGTTVSWEIRKKMLQAIDSTSTLPAPASPLDVTSAAGELSPFSLSSFAGIIFLQAHLFFGRG